MEYFFKYKKSIIWRSKKVCGHRYEEKQDKMILFYKDGGVEEIANWKNHSCKLGIDWVIAIKKTMEKESGNNVPINV